MPEPGCIGAYVLDALDDVERARLERHLRSCEPCTLELIELQETAAALADQVATRPTDRLRGQVLAEVARTRQLAPVPPPSERPHRLVALVSAAWPRSPRPG